MEKKKQKNGKKLNIKIKKDNNAHTEQMTPTLGPLDVVQNMDRFFTDYPWMPMWWQRWKNASMLHGSYRDSQTKITPVDLVDMGDQYKIVAEMPGVSKENLDVHITQNAVNICGEAKTEIEEEHEGYLRRERSYSTICRNMPFPEEVNPDKAEATLKDGILKITVAKKTPMKSKGRTIPIK